MSVATADGVPSGQRSRAPASVSWRRCAAGVVRRGHQLAGIFVAQLVQGESAAFGHAQRFVQHFAGIARQQLRHRLQAAFAVLLDAPAEIPHRRFEADGGEHIAQRLPFRRVHGGGARGDDGDV